MASSFSKDPDVEVSRTTTDIYSYTRAYPDGIADTVAHCHTTKDSFKVPLSTFFEPWKNNSSAPAFGTNMPNSVSKPVYK